MKGASEGLLSMLRIGVMLVLAGSLTSVRAGVLLENFEGAGAFGTSELSAESQAFGQNVDLFNGTVTFSATDVSLPTNSALSVEFRRIFSVDNGRFVNWGYTDNYDLIDKATEDHKHVLGTEWELDVPYLRGVYDARKGWVSSLDPAFPTGPVTPNRCSAGLRPPSVQGVWPSVTSYFKPDDYWSGITVNIPGMGVEQLLAANPGAVVPSDGRDYRAVTKSNWRAACLSSLINSEGEGFVVALPNGTKYYFDWMASRRYPSVVNRVDGGTVWEGSRGGTWLGWDPNNMVSTPSGTYVLIPRVEVFLYASKVEDRFGNWVKYSYNSENPFRLESVSSNDGQSLNVIYGGNGKVQSVNWEGGQVTYHYLPAGGIRLHTQLQRVVLPAGGEWVYQSPHMAVLNGVGAHYRTPLFHECNIQIYTMASQFPPDSRDSSEMVIVNPSGATGRFKFRRLVHGMNRAPGSCYLNRFSQLPPALILPSIYEYSVTGTALPQASVWKYTYETSWSMDSQCSDQKGSCDGTTRTTVEAPNQEKTTYTFGNDYRDNFRNLLSERSLDSSGIEKKLVEYEYASSVGSFPFSDYAGQSINIYHVPYLSKNRPLIRRTIRQQGVSFVLENTAFDQYVNPTAITRSSSLGWSKSETRAYRHFTNHWLMSQPQNVIDVASGAVENAWFYWSATGQLSSQRQFGVTDGTRSYNTDGTLATHLLPEGNTLQYSDWYRGVPRLVTNSADGTSSSAVVSPAGKITSITDETGATTGFEYDVMGRIKKITPPTGDSTTWSNTEYVYEQLNTANYGISGSYWRSTETTGTSKRETYYDALWRPILVRAYDTGAPSLARFVRYGYDAVGNRNFESYPGFVSSQANYVTALSSGVTTSYDALSRVTAQTSSSELGALTSTTDYLGNFVVRTSNPRGYETEQAFMAYDDPAQAWPVSLTQAKGHSEQIDTTIARDVWGKPTAITRSGWYRDFTPAEYQSLTRRFVYDSNQRLCKQYDPESGWRVIDYTSSNAIYWVADGQSLTSTTDCQRTSVPSSAKVIRSYNLRGMLTGIAYPDSTDDAAFTYWPDGALYTATVGTGASAKAWTYQYNKRRLLSAETLSLDGRSFSLNYRFNGLGQVSQVQYPDAEWVSYSPNVFGEPTQAGSVASGASYSRFGGLTGFTYGNGLLYDATENQRGLIETQRWRNGSVPLLHYGYTYDAHGNLKTQDDYVGSTAEYHNEGRSLGYDGLDRMTVANSSPQPPLRAPTPWAYSWGDGRMTYDVMDNLRSYALAAIDFRYEHDANNRPRRIIFAGSTFRNYGYNARGQMTYRDHDTGGQTLSWDSADRLLGISGVGGSEQYAYDAHGHRVRSSKAGETRYQMYSRAGQLMYDESTGGERRKYYYLGSRLVGQTEGVSSQMRYLLTDRQGSVRAKTDANRVISYETVRGPYGSVLLGWAYQNGPALAGHMEDAISGLTYMEARYYDPVAMRFISPDPVGVSGSNGGNFNRYWYANNNPYTNIDPDGRFARIPTSYWNPQAQEAAAYRAQSIARATASSGSTVADFTPVIGDIKGIYEAIQDPTFSNVAAAGVGLIPVVGDSAAKIIKMGGNVAGTVADATRGAATAERGLWKLTQEGTERVVRSERFGKIYKSASDGLWWARDTAGHGGSEWKVFRESSTGLEWYRDADKHGDFIVGKHKGDVGKFIPWKDLTGSGF